MGERSVGNLSRPWQKDDLFLPRAGRLRAGGRWLTLRRAAWIGSNRQRWRRCIRACNLDDTSSPRANGQSEAVQLYDGRNQVQAETQTRHVPRLVRPVEPPQHGIAFVFADA